MKKLGTFILLLAFACSENVGDFSTPMTRDDFKEVIKKGLLIEARGNKERVDLQMDTVPVAAYYEQLFTDLHVDEEAFMQTFDTYNKHPKAFQEIYSEIADELELELDSLKKTSDS